MSKLLILLFCCRKEQSMPTLFDLNGSVKLHFFHLESELKKLYTVTNTKNFKTLFLFCYFLIPPCTTCVGHSTTRPGVGKMLQNVTADI
jgi:hypothetical protein